MATQGSAESRQIARHLVEREAAGVSDESAVGTAMQRVYGRVADRLARSVGEDGYAALLARALSRAQPGRATAVGEDLEALLATIVDILGGIIGPEMARASSMADQGSDDRVCALAERLLLGALREQDAARIAFEDGERGRFLASVGRDLAQSLDVSATQAAVARRTLPRGDSWCIVDIIELDGVVRRLGSPSIAQGRVAGDASSQTMPSGVEGVADAGNGRTLVVPLAVRGSVLGAITFVTRENDPPLSADELRLASDIADLCALALDNARLYREAQVLREIADEANRAKSTFLSNMSHELMTPLNAISGYVSLLEMGLRGPVTAEQLVDLGRIRQNQAHLLTLISEVLAQARSEGARLQYRFSDVSVQALLREVVSMLQSTVDERHLAVSGPSGSVDEIIWADADRVRQILVNLVMNAIKYGKGSGGTITFASTVAPTTIGIHVTDDGAGIPDEKLEAIFEPFVQLPNGSSDRRGGVGLGLAISRDLARAMNGDLTVSSSPGTGSRFTLELPRARRPRTFGE
jgi:signal transduction histidine kinase